VGIELSGQGFTEMCVSESNYNEGNLTGLTLTLSITEVLPPPDAVVSFVPLGTFSTTTIDFSPNAALPTGVTYKLADDKGNNWESDKNGFDGKVTASEYYSVTDAVTFTQTFYLNGTKITGGNSERTVVVNASTFGGMRFSSLGSDSGSVTLRYNP
jgi:hypothetical protein